MPEKPSLPPAGAAFMMPLQDGRFTVCRVLRENTEEERQGHGCPQILVAASPWIGAAAPDLSQPELRGIHHLNHHSWDDPNLLWVSEPPPESFRRLGVIEPSADVGIPEAGNRRYADGQASRSGLKAMGRTSP